MRTARTIRNCLPVFRFVCQQRWEALAPTDEPGVRHCGQCDQRVYFCTTDAETIAHARAGDCIAREIPDPSELGVVALGRPAQPMPGTPRQAEARRLTAREHGIDDAIRNAGRASRCCPRCEYPALDYRVRCRVCGFEFGRVTGELPDAEPGAAADGGGM